MPETLKKASPSSSGVKPQPTEERLEFEVALDRLQKRLDVFTGRYQEVQNQKKRTMRRWANVVLVPLALFAWLTVRSIVGGGFGDEDDLGPLWAILGIGAIIGYFILRYMGAHQHVEGLVRAEGFEQALNLLADDLHPQVLLAGQVDFRPSDQQKPYRTATSPYSGASKQYFKFPWLQLQTTLRDGNRLAIKIKEKMKTKSGSSVVEEQRFQGYLRVDPDRYTVREEETPALPGAIFSPADIHYDPERRILKFSGTIRDENVSGHLAIGIAAALRWAYDALKPLKNSP